VSAEKPADEEIFPSRRSEQQPAPIRLRRRAITRIDFPDRSEYLDPFKPS